MLLRGDKACIIKNGLLVFTDSILLEWVKGPKNAFQILTMLSRYIYFLPQWNLPLKKRAQCIVLKMEKCLVRELLDKV